MAYPERVLMILRQRHDLNEDDASRDNQFNKMPPRDALEHLTAWELGYGGWSSWFLNQLNAVGADYSFPD